MVAYADIEVCQGVKMFGLRVEQRPDRTFRVYAPNANGSRTSAFSPAAVDEIAQAVAEYKIKLGSEPLADDVTTNR